MYIIQILHFMILYIPMKNWQKSTFPEICPEITFEDELYNPTFLLESDYYVNRYKEPDLMYKVIDNFGNGFDSLYGTRNMRTVLHGVAYRGGANNYYHKTDKRNNHNPLPDDGIANLCKEGFSHSIYLYKQNWDSARNMKHVIVLTRLKMKWSILSMITTIKSTLRKCSG